MSLVEEDQRLPVSSERSLSYEIVGLLGAAEIEGGTVDPVFDVLSQNGECEHGTKVEERRMITHQWRGMDSGHVQ